MTVSFLQTKEDVMAFYRYFMITNKTLGRSITMARFLAPVVFIGMWLLLTDFQYFGTVDIIAGAPFFIVSVLWIIFMPRWVIKRSLKRVATQMDDPLNANLYDQRAITFDKDGFVVKETQTESRSNWTVVKNAVEDNGHYFLVVAVGQAVIVPKHAFEEGQQTEFKELLDRNGIVLTNFEKTKKQ